MEQNWLDKNGKQCVCRFLCPHQYLRPTDLLGENNAIF